MCGRLWVHIIYPNFPWNIRIGKIKKVRIRLYLNYAFLQMDVSLSEALESYRFKKVFAVKWVHIIYPNVPWNIRKGEIKKVRIRLYLKYAVLQMDVLLSEALESYRFKGVFAVIKGYPPIFQNTSKNVTFYINQKSLQPYIFTCTCIK